MKLSELWQTIQAHVAVRRSPKKTVEPIAADVGQTQYYHERSVAYTTVQMVVIMVLAVYLAVSLLTGDDLLSMEQLSLLVSDLGSAIVIPETGSTDTLTYVADEANQFAAYRGGLAVLGKEKLTVFTATGRETYATSLTYQTPRMAVAGNYLLVYDLGGRELAVYHAFSNLFSSQTDTPIRHVAVSDSGSFAVVTDDDGYASCVVVYDSHFRVISRVHLKEYALCCAFSADGTNLTMATLSSQAGHAVTTLYSCVPGKEEMTVVTSLSDFTPMAMRHTKKGLILLGQERVCLLDSQGEIVREYSLVGEQVKRSVLYDDSCLVYVSADSYTTNTRILAFDDELTLLFDVCIEGSVSDAGIVSNHKLCVLTDDALQIYQAGEDRTEAEAILPLHGQYHTLLPMEDEDREVFVCTDAVASCIRLP